MAFIQRFWSMLKDDILDFMGEFHSRGKLSKGIGASFITPIPKKEGEIGIKNFRPVSLIGIWELVQNPSEGLGREASEGIT